MLAYLVNGCLVTILVVYKKIVHCCTVTALPYWGRYFQLVLKSTNLFDLMKPSECVVLEAVKECLHVTQFSPSPKFGPI